MTQYCMTDQKTKKKDFVEINFTGYIDGKVFDSNIEEDLKEISPESKPEKTIVCIGEQMVVPGLDKALEDKVFGSEYEVNVPYREGFGKKHRELIKTIPLKVFTSQKINPYPGASFLLDNQLARIITISGARVLTDFNNPLAGKDLKYKFTISRIVIEDKEKIDSLFKFFLRFIPEFKIIEDKVIVEGTKPLEKFILLYRQKFKDLLGKDLAFQIKENNEEKIQTTSKSPE